MIDIVDACSKFCPVGAVDGDDIVFSSWIAVGLFVLSEGLAFIDIEPNGVLHAVAGFFRRSKHVDVE